MEIKIYKQKDGKSPFESWFKKLHKQAAAKVVTALSRLESGNTSAIKWKGSIGWVRIFWGKGLRIYLHQDGEQLLVLFCGGDKTRQNEDIQKAKELLKEYEAEKKGEEQ